MKEYPVIKYRGFSFRPLVALSQAKIDAEGEWYEYSIEGWFGNKSRIIKGSGIYENSQGAASAANTFARQEIDNHINKYKNSLFYRIYISIGHCPASKFS